MIDDDDCFLKERGGEENEKKKKIKHKREGSKYEISGKNKNRFFGYL